MRAAVLRGFPNAAQNTIFCMCFPCSSMRLESRFCRTVQAERAVRREMHFSCYGSMTH